MRVPRRLASLLPGLTWALLLVLALLSAGRSLAGPRSAPPPSMCKACHLLDLGYGTLGHGEPKAAGCATCHTTSGELDVEGHLVLDPATDTTCQGCHEGWSHAGHPEVAAGRCQTCHAPHQDLSRKTTSWPLRTGAACAQCHAPDPQASTTHTVLRRGECAGCHSLHGPASDHLLRDGGAVAGCADCHPEQATVEPGEQWAIGPDGCDRCHASHESPYADLLVAPEPELCATCHEPLPQAAHPHGAVALGACSGCHDPHAERHDEDLGQRIADAELCFGCHSDDASLRPVVHEPLVNGECGTCHAAHGGDQPGGLNDTQAVVCGSCHADQDRRPARYPHLARSGECTACHDAHASERPWLLASDVNSLCIACHPELPNGYHVSEGQTMGGQHPVGPGGRDPLRADRELSCTSCHDPHGSDQQSLFYRADTVQALCRECHGDLYGQAALLPERLQRGASASWETVAEEPRPEVEPEPAVEAPPPDAPPDVVGTAGPRGEE